MTPPAGLLSRRGRAGAEPVALALRRVGAAPGAARWLRTVATSWRGRAWACAERGGGPLRFHLTEEPGDPLIGAGAGTWPPPAMPRARLTAASLTVPRESRSRRRSRKRRRD